MPADFNFQKYRIFSFQFHRDEQPAPETIYPFNTLT
jgi:hypothetical protein